MAAESGCLVEAARAAAAWVQTAQKVSPAWELPSRRDQEDQEAAKIRVAARACEADAGQCAFAGSLAAESEQL